MSGTTTQEAGREQAGKYFRFQLATATYCYGSRRLLWPQPRGHWWELLQGGLPQAKDGIILS